ncbi:MAG: hypothetical protein M0R51_17180 [Clostridia bacterium]|jgi:hypothetical protein|nr:hypothetical protein [Clostridia bacterium]
MNKREDKYEKNKKELTKELERLTPIIVQKAIDGDYECTRLLLNSICTPEEVDKGMILSDEIISVIVDEVMNKINEITENKLISCESIDKIIEKIESELYGVRFTESEKQKFQGHEQC